MREDVEILQLTKLICIYIDPNTLLKNDN